MAYQPSMVIQYQILFIYTYIYIICKKIVGNFMSRVFAYGLGDQGSIPGRVIPKTQKMVLDVTLLNT